MGSFKMKLLLFFVIVVLNITTGSTKPAVTPQEYEIYIQTSKNDFEADSNQTLTFSGTVKINFIYPKNSIFNISVHVIQETNINLYKLTGHNAKGNDIINNVKMEYSKGFLHFTTNSSLNYDNYTLLLNFTNPYRKDMKGFYRSYYNTPDNKTRWLVTTHFEPTYARSAFPCFDDPSMKAFFTIIIAYPKILTDYKVLCNTPIENVDVNGEFKVARCKKTTTPMSTYLVSFAVSDFKNTEAVTFESDYLPSVLGQDRKLTTYGRKSIIDANEGQLSLNVGKEALKELTEYLGIGYAFEKVDFIGIPDFSAGAMENWGLITYREKLLFFNEHTGSASQKQSSTLTMVHELVHQWFGNLVTLASWNYIWLNEAFATYISHIIGNRLENPNTTDWEYMKQVLFDEVHSRAFEADGMPAAKPLSQNHENENLVSAAFDDIPYAKGASVLRMWDLSLPENQFQESLVHYMQNNKEKNVEPSDLYQSFKNVANMEEDFFNVWHKNPGYPVVTVEKNGDIYTLSQTRFFWENISNVTKDIKYVVPITYTLADSPKTYDTVPKLWLRENKIQLYITSKWFIINNQQAGYYRVNYNEENWNALSDALNGADREKIHELNRAQIINDVYSLARSVHKNYVDYATALNLSLFLEKEESYLVWRSAFHAFDFLLSKVAQEENISNKLKAYILQLVKPHFKPLNESGLNLKHIDKRKQADMARWACALNYEPCQKSAVELYPKASEYPDVQETILCNTVKVKDEVWNEIFQKYETESDSSKKMMYLSALGCTKNESIIEKYLNMTISENLIIRLQDRSSALFSIYRGDAKNVDITFKFIEKNFELIEQKFGGINSLGKILTGIARNLHSDNDIARMTALVEKIKNSSIHIPSESLDNAISTIRSNREWILSRITFIEKYLNSSSSASYSILLLFVSFIVSYQY